MRQPTAPIVEPARQHSGRQAERKSLLHISYSTRTQKYSGAATRDEAMGVRATQQHSTKILLPAKRARKHDGQKRASHRPGRLGCVCFRMLRTLDGDAERTKSCCHVDVKITIRQKVPKITMIGRPVDWVADDEQRIDSLDGLIAIVVLCSPLL